MKETVYILDCLLSYVSPSFYTFVLQRVVDAVTWQDEFDLETQENWKLRGDDSTWKIEHGFLHARINTQKQWTSLFEVFEYINQVGDFSNITIKAENIGASGDIKFGIVMGKHFLNDNGDLAEIGYYLFSQTIC